MRESNDRIGPRFPFGPKVARLARERGLSNDELREKVGMKQSRFDYLIEGLLPPEKEDPPRFATVLGVSPDSLVGYDDSIEDQSRENLKAFLSQIRESHRFDEIWSIVREDIRSSSYRNQKPWDDRMFMALLRDMGLTDFGFEEELKRRDDHEQTDDRKG